MKNTTSFEIAKLCGVSRGTVYRALNNKPGIKPETKEKILRVANSLGYRPNFVAQSLVKKKTMTIGIIVFDLNNRIFSQIINSIESYGRKNNYFVYLTLSHKDSDLEKEQIQYLVDRQVDAIIMMSVNKGKEFEDFLKQFNIPIVTFGNKISENIPFVWINDKQAIKDAVSYLHNKKYTKIIYVCPQLGHLYTNENKYSPEQRLEGFIEALEELDDMNAEIVSTHDYLQTIHELVSHSSEKIAILCTSDIYALQVAKSLKKNNIKIPEDVGVMGFDNIDILEFTSPALTSISFSLEEIGRSLFNSIMHLINEEDAPKEILLDHNIIARESV
ncbi:LacI family DNA-binding transcriptional regulator [Lederbergia citri]|uniref:LacI family DNA-binding transcriptional regulator n=1 Tax=Lederbergia citri TaxID=2833580 RepID=A0A942TJ64_9BACI|nr:LacI family DNA-binding transcriptional regulator [Lederbergia citri]MBS4197607.1 LacI family DNA-binding transcriptional regulator [Lederbergia citri]